MPETQTEAHSSTLCMTLKHYNGNMQLKAEKNAFNTWGKMNTYMIPFPDNSLI